MTLHIRTDGTQSSKAASISVIDLSDQGLGLYRTVLKRAFESLCILASLPLVVPFIVFFALLISLDGHNPFYSQLRVGKDGRVFRMWKLRTMVPNAHGLLNAYLERDLEAKAEWDANQKLKNDPRVTRTGRILRKTSLDELPQLWNVLAGTMSLVGPRPMMLEQQEMYVGKSYYNLRPGITGLWQISERNDCEFVERVRFDNEYDRTIGFLTDLRILWRTVAVVVRGTGY